MYINILILIYVERIKTLSLDLINYIHQLENKTTKLKVQIVCSNFLFAVISFNQSE